MTRFEKITQVLFNAIDELNQLRPKEDHLEKDLAAPLAGDHGRLDSAGLINLIVLVEQNSADELGAPVLLTDDDTMTQVNKIFRTLGSLAEYLDMLLEEKRDG